MSTTGQFSSKNPTIKRILKEANELATQPSSDYHAAPLESDLFEWHFTLRGPPAPSPYEGGIYHGRIVLPPAYPLKPPSFRFLTPTGRFEVNREICLSISGHHEETWQPAWGIRTALVAIRSFMDTDAKGQLGGMDASEEVRRRLATQSPSSRCPTCAKSNDEIMKEHDEVVKSSGGDTSRTIEVPEQLRLAYREDLAKPNGRIGTGSDENETQTAVHVGATASTPTSRRDLDAFQAAAAVPNISRAPLAPVAQRPQNRRNARHIDEDLPGWINPAIYAVLAVLLYMLWRKFC